MRRTVLAVAVLAVSGAANAQGLPPVPAPPENPMTAEKAVLGKILFWEEQLSSDDTMSCGTCHRPGAGGSDPRLGLHPGYDGLFHTADDVQGSPGVVHRDAQSNLAPDPAFGLDVQVTGRTAQPAFTSQWSPEQFWDGRASSRFVDPQTGRVSIPAGGSLESQALGPIMSTVEMGHDGRAWTEVAQKLAAARPLALATNLPADVQTALLRDPTYPALFQRAFGTPAITAERIAFALATYERKLVPDQTPWDLHMAGIPGAMTTLQRQGWSAFRGLSCDVCHTPPFFTDHSYRALGLRPWIEDEGRKAVTGQYADRGKFKVPSLRNAGLKASFMHNGALTTWTQVFDLYDHRLATFPDNQDPFYLGMSVPPVDRPALQEFLQNGLTDSRVAQALPPFDRPTLASELPKNRVIGAGSAGSGGAVPTLIGHQPAFVGAVDFRVGIRDALGGRPALLFVSVRSRAYPGLPIPIHVDLGVGGAFAAITSGSGPGGGYATFQLPIPNDTNLRGGTLFFQAFVADPGAPIGLAASDAIAAPVL